jgi:hypothetical protein
LLLNEDFAMNGTTVDGEPVKRFRIFRADAQGNTIGDVVVEYDSETEVLAYQWRLDCHYVIYENRRRVTKDQLRNRVWTCPICGQYVIQRPNIGPITPPGYIENCKLRDHLIGNECIARCDLAGAKRLLDQF